MNPLMIIPKDLFAPAVVKFLEKNPITEIEEIEYLILFKEYSGIIFYIPDEKIYGLEMVWERGEEMMIRFGAYSQYINQLLHKLELEYEEHLDFYANLFN